MSANLGYMFYVDYYEGLDFDNPNLSSKIDNLISTSSGSNYHLSQHSYIGNVHFSAATTYPGLLLGSGNIHEIPGVTGQAILGFHFDYTSGLPVIPGSSIKGVLRSAFAHPEYIAELLETIGLTSQQANSIDIKKLEIEIFGQPNGSDKVSQGKDVFFDAVIKGTSGKILGDDYITPHKNPLGEPIPLRFVKVMPGVKFGFDFLLQDGIISSNDKEILFRLILQDHGLGAKTNVGYGYFEDFRSDMSDQEIEQAAYMRAINSTDLNTIIDFLEKFSDSIHRQKVQEHYEKIKRQNTIEEIRGKFDRVKGDKVKLKSFVNTYKDNELAAEILQEASELLESKGAKSAVNLDDIIKMNKLSEINNTLKKIDKELSENEKKSLIEHILSSEVKKRRKDINYPLFKKIFGDEAGQKLGDDLQTKV